MPGSNREGTLGRVKSKPQMDGTHGKPLASDEEMKMQRACSKQEEKKSRAQSGLRVQQDPSLEMTVSDVSLDRSFQNLKHQVIQDRERKGMMREISRNQLTD